MNSCLCQRERQMKTNEQLFVLERQMKNKLTVVCVRQTDENQWPKPHNFTLPLRDNYNFIFRILYRSFQSSYTSKIKLLIADIDFDILFLFITLITVSSIKQTY